MVTPAKTRLTVQEFLALPDDLPGLVELIDGEIYVNSPKDPHQHTIMRLIALLLRLMPGGQLRCAPMSVHFDEHNFPEPDIFWVNPNNPNCKLGEDGYWHGAPDLIVEVLSTSTARKDRGKKLQLYQRYGVREYWLVDTEGEYIEVYRLEGSHFVPQGAFGSDETFVSAVLGDKTIEVNAVFTG